MGVSNKMGFPSLADRAKTRQGRALARDIEAGRQAKADARKRHDSIIQGVSLVKGKGKTKNQ
jgi:hypothetical protein